MVDSKSSLSSYAMFSSSMDDDDDDDEMTLSKLSILWKFSETERVSAFFKKADPGTFFSEALHSSYVL